MPITLQNAAPVYSRQIHNLYVSGINIKRTVIEQVKHNILPQTKGTTPFPIEAFSLIILVLGYIRLTKDGLIIDQVRQTIESIPLNKQATAWFIKLMPALRIVDMKSGAQISVSFTNSDVTNIRNLVTNGVFLTAFRQVATWLDINGYSRDHITQEVIDSTQAPTICSFWALQDQDFIDLDSDQLCPSFTEVSDKVTIDDSKVKEIDIFIDEHESRSEQEKQNYSMLSFHSPCSTNTLSINASLAQSLTWLFIAKDQDTTNKLDVLLHTMLIIMFNKYEWEFLQLEVFQNMILVPTQRDVQKLELIIKQEQARLESEHRRSLSIQPLASDSSGKSETTTSKDETADQPLSNTSTAGNKGRNSGKLSAKPKRDVKAHSTLQKHEHTKIIKLFSSFLRTL